MSHMRLHIALSACLFVLLSPDLGGMGARAQEMPKAVVAVLDYQQILLNAEAAKDIRRQISEYRDNFRDSIAGEERRLRAAESELKRQRSVLGPEAFEQKRQDFKRQVIAAQRRGQSLGRQLDRSFNLAMNEVRGAVIPIVKDLTHERGLTLVVDSSQVLFADRALDVTKEVLDRLNKKLRTIAVPKPQE